MIFAAIAAATAVLVVAGVLLAPPWRRLRRTLVLVELTDGRTIDGLHTSRALGYVSLVNARTFDADGHAISIDGTINIPRGQVAWIIDGHDV